MKLLFENWRKFLNESKAEVSNELTEIAINSMLAMSVFEDERESLSEAESAPLNYLVSHAANPNLEIVQKFSDSLYSGQRSGFLTYYSPEELGRMDLYLLEGHNAGFAIKDGDDIVSVHNNSSLKRLGSKFLSKAKEVGGARLDHFDGFLSGLYRKHGFTNVYEVYQWDENYKPATWNYEPVDVTNPETSIYAESLSELTYEDPSALLNEPTEITAESGLKVEINPNLKYNSYRYGRPDVIMRKLT
jgi:hypothetical protein